MITKAVVPVAGRGTRLHPMTSVLPKALFPLVDAAGRCRPVIHWICAEAASAGISDLAIVVSPSHERLVREYLAAAASADPPLPPRVQLVVQPQPLGFGDALARAAGFAGKENFLLMLGDHVYRQALTAPTCAAQVVSAFEKLAPAAMIGMQPVHASELDKVGVARGEPIVADIYRCTDFVEKPTLDVARNRLVTAGMEKDHYLAHAGLYAFTPEIFECLAQTARDQAGRGGEIALADAQSVLLSRRPNDYYLCRIKGEAYDTGTPEGYANTMAALRQ